MSASNRLLTTAQIDRAIEMGRAEQAAKAAGIPAMKRAEYDATHEDFKGTVYGPVCILGESESPAK